MSDLEARPQEYVCRSTLPVGPEELLVTARKVWLGKTTGSPGRCRTGRSG